MTKLKKELSRLNHNQVKSLLREALHQLKKQEELLNQNPSLTGKIIFHKFSGCFV